jgi:alkylation response protein AidB-like acyl-CoA dehydrogenase
VRIPAPATTYRTMEGRRGADFRLEQLSVPALACIASGAEARDALVRADNAALLLTAADTVAALAALIQQTVSHLKERRQFGVTLSSFQVLRHRTADMYVRYLGAKGLLMHAFQEYESGAASLRRTLRLMKVALAESARACAESAIQMHGGMGVSEEVLATRLAQRLLASEFRYGDRLTHAARLLAPQHPDAPADESPRAATHLSRSSP